MTELLRRPIDPTRPLIKDGKAMLDAASAHLKAAGDRSKAAVVSRVPTARQASSYRRSPLQRAGSTRHYQSRVRVGSEFTSSAAPRPTPRAESALKYSSYNLMAGSAFNRRPVVNRADAMNIVRSRANARMKVATLTHRFEVVNRIDLGDGEVSSNHLRTNPRFMRSANNNRRDSRLTPVMAAVLKYG